MQQLRFRDKSGWLASRRGPVVTATDTPKILGVSRFQKREDVFLKKTGRAEPVDLSNNPNVQFGSVTEWYVEQRAQEEYPDLWVANPGPFTIQSNPQFPWLQCTVDCFDWYGRSIVELKTGTSKAWERGAIPEYEWQVRHQMLVTGAEQGWLLVLIADQPIKARWRDMPRSLATLKWLERGGGDDPGRAASAVSLVRDLDACELRRYEVTLSEEQRELILAETKRFADEVEEWNQNHG